MPIQIKAPDGSIAQFPDGTPDSTITSVMAKSYPQPSLLDRAVASPIGRLAHDVVGGLVKGMTYGPDQMVKAALPVFGQPSFAPISTAIDQPYEGALARNRNTPGYAQARSAADTMMLSRGSGLEDQLTAAFNPATAGAAGLFGGIDASNAAADAQSAAQANYASRHPILSTGAQIAGGLVAAPEGALGRIPAKIAKQAVPSIADLKAAAKLAYNQVDNSGHIIAAPSYDAMVSDLQAKLANEGIDKTLHPNALAAYQRLADAKGGNITFQGLDTQRKIASDAIGASATNKADQRLGYVVQNHIDDYVNALSPSDLVPGTGDPSKAVATLADARNYWSRAAQAQTIQQQIDKAMLKSKMYSQSGLENATRAQFRQLALNDKAMARLSPEVQQAVKDVATGGPVSNVLRAVGKYAPHGPVATAAGLGVGAMLGGVTGAAEGGLASVAVPMIGELARVGATRMTSDAARRALDIAALGRTRLPTLPQPALQAPALPQRLPLGLFGSSALAVNRQ